MSALSGLFTTILNMSITATYVAAGVILARLLLRKAPKIFSYALWAVVLFRLLCPLSFTSAVSFLGLLSINSQNTAGVLEYVPQDIGFMPEPTVQSGLGSLDSAVNSSLPAATPMTSVNPMQIWMYFLSLIWLAGIIVLILYSVLSYVKIKRQLLTATLLKDNIYESDRIGTAFVCGFVHPKIYMPLGVADADLAYILEHERTHIGRRDYLVKPIAFFALILHWFNPVMWLSFALMSRDMEMSCDESVLHKMNPDAKGGYSSSLLALSAKSNGLFAANPLAFGESHVKARIKNVLNYKKPAFWVIIAALLAVLAVGVGLATNPHNNTRSRIAIGLNIKVPTILHNNDQPQDKEVYMHIANGILAKQPDELSEEYYRGALADLDNDGQDEFIVIYLDGNWEYYQLYTCKSGAPVLLREGELFANAGAPSGGLKLVNYEGDQNLCIWKSNTEAGEKWKAAYIGQLFDIGNGELILKHTFDFNYHIDAYRYQEEVLHQDVIPENSTFLKDGKTISYEEFQEIRADLTNPIKELCSAGKEYTGVKLKDFVKNGIE